MMIKVALQHILFLCACGAICLLYAKKAPQYITDSKQFSSIGIDRHDIEHIAQEASQKLLDSRFVRTLKGQQILAISDLENLTHDDVDVEFLSRKIARILRDSNVFALTNVISGSGGSTDKLIDNARNLNNDARFNPYTTQELGTLQAPNYSLSGKINERVKQIGEQLRVDYDFLFTLTDLHNGRVVWDDEAHITKIINKTEAARFMRLGAGTCAGGDVLACEQEAQEAFNNKNYEQAKALLHRACKLNNKEACHAYKELKKALKQLTHQAKNGVFGLNIGASTGETFYDATINMIPIPYRFNYNGEQREGVIRHYNSSYNDDDITSIYLFNAGIWYQQKEGMYIELNALYGGYDVTTNTCSSSGYCYTSDLNEMRFSHTMLGGRARIGIGFYDDIGGGVMGGFALFVGGGMLQDIDSTMKSLGGGLEINKALHNRLPFWELGMNMSVFNFLIDMGFRHMLNGKDENNWASIMYFHIGAGLILPIW